MKKLFFTAVALLLTVLSVNAQVKIESPHPDLDIKITRCAYASGTVVVDMVITNFGNDDEIKVEDYSISMYDDEGNSYNKNNSKILFGFPNIGLKSGNHPYGFSGVFPQDIPLKFRIQFGSISANASKFSLVKIGLKSNGVLALRNEKPLVIRNLEWEK